MSLVLILCQLCPKMYQLRAEALELIYYSQLVYISISFQALQENRIHLGDFIMYQ